MPALRLFIEARNKAAESGFTDNGGAIQSVERILDILSMHVCYPHLTYINSLKSDPTAEISVAAQEARQRGEPLLIEQCPAAACLCAADHRLGQRWRQ